MAWLPLVIGLSSVLQATVNRRMMRSWDVLTVTAFNSALILALAVALLWARSWLRPPPGTLFAARFEASAFRAEFLVPSAASAFFMAAMPVAVERLGASRAFPLLIAGQLCMSLAWDRFAGGTSVDASRALGAVLVLIGAVVANRG